MRSREAQRQHDDPAEPSRILLVNGSSRSEHTCPGEMSKTWRLVEIAQRDDRGRGGFEIDILDLSRTTSEFGEIIHPCKSCVSTAMPLCHWPCSCYPNHALGQMHDWMNEIYPLWVAAHGVMIVTPVNWYQAPGPLKAMMDRLVCADGGNAARAGFSFAPATHGIKARTPMSDPAAPSSRLDRLVDFARRAPGRCLAAVLALHVVVWTALPALLSLQSAARPRRRTSRSGANGSSATGSIRRCRGGSTTARSR